MLDDGRIPNIVPWFRERTAGLPEPMADELTTWFELELSGSTTPPRVKARPHRLENDQSRLASREAGCPLLREDRRVMRLVISVIAAQQLAELGLDWASA
ncbi:hypothetical protein [Streptomyces hawaiiensis]|uniref:hypothetical protein n=1 Tax=Streptomyces hawaiiensis TaxID=67305 RepID=UPI00365472D0